MDGEFDAIYARVGPASVPPERLLKAPSLQILFSIRSGRLLVKSLDDNLLHLWFVCLGIDDAIWDYSTFSQNRDRLFNEGLARTFFERLKALTQRRKLTNDEHFSVDGALIEASASHKSSKPKDGGGPPTGPGRTPEGDSKGQLRINDIHASTTDPDARLFHKLHGAEARLLHMSHILMENRSGLIVTTPANPATQREAALGTIRRPCRRGATIGADKGYDTRDFVTRCRRAGATPHIAPKRTGSPLDGRTRRHAGYKILLKVRKRIQEAFDWFKTIGSLSKTILIGREKLAGQALLCFGAYTTWCASTASLAGGMPSIRSRNPPRVRRTASMGHQMASTSTAKRSNALPSASKTATRSKVESGLRFQHAFLNGLLSLFLT